MQQSIKQSNLTLELDEQQTVWHFISCAKFSSPCAFISILRTNNIRYFAYISLIFILEILRTFLGSNLYTALLSSVFYSLEIMILIFFIFECNIMIFKQSLTSFEVYYKTINMLIGAIADKIDCNWYESLFYDSSNTINYRSELSCGLYIAGILSSLNIH